VGEHLDHLADGRNFPIVKGGSYMSSDVRLDRRVTDRDPNKGEEYIGFRTISTTPPR
jgi:hypothetical protein